MYISHKSNIIQSIEDTEWQCRRVVKQMSLTEYWTWLATVTSEDENGTKSYDFSGEDYEIVETNAPLSYETKDSEDNDITVTFNQSGHIHEGHYHLKWDASKKVIVKDDDALSACQIAEKWKSVRNDRNRRLAETDYLALSDQTLSAGMKEYRSKLRSVPQDNSDPDNITWPTMPS